MDNAKEKNSGWTNDGVLHMQLEINTYSPMGGASYIKSPQWAIFKGLVNVKNTDNNCFEYALTASLLANNIKKKDRVIKYKDKNLFDLSGIEMPAKISSTTYKKFEKQNPNYYLCVHDLNGLKKCC